MRSVNLRTGTLMMRAAGPPYVAIGGPVTFVETRFRVGSTTYCGRFAQPPGTFQRNQADVVSAKGPTAPCQFTCGNGIVEAGEACDDGNLVSGDGCDANCTADRLRQRHRHRGRGLRRRQRRERRRLRANCTLEGCGDGIVDPGEDCDDGNVADGDCCSSSCGFESVVGARTTATPAPTSQCNGAGVCVQQEPAACTDHERLHDRRRVHERLPAAARRFSRGSTRSTTTTTPVPLNGDRDEFVEIAGPAGTDLSGYQIVSVEGAGPGCASAPATRRGLRPLLDHDPERHGARRRHRNRHRLLRRLLHQHLEQRRRAGKCDAMLPAPFTDTNLQNGHLTNADVFTCPDGLLVLDPDDNFVDAMSYEGIVRERRPVRAVLPRHAVRRSQRDEGWLVKVSIEKTTQHARARDVGDRVARSVGARRDHLLGADRAVLPDQHRDAG